MFNTDHPKLVLLASYEGYGHPLDLLEDCVHDSIVPGICMNEGCDQTAEYEPDQREGFCEQCGTQTVQSALVIAGFV